MDLHSLHMQTSVVKDYYLAKMAYTEQLWGGQFKFVKNSATEVIKHKTVSLPKPLKNRKELLQGKMFSMKINDMKHQWNWRKEPYWGKKAFDLYPNQFPWCQWYFHIWNTIEQEKYGEDNCSFQTLVTREKNKNRGLEQLLGSWLVNTWLKNDFEKYFLSSYPGIVNGSRRRKGQKVNFRKHWNIQRILVVQGLDIWRSWLQILVIIGPLGLRKRGVQEWWGQPHHSSKHCICFLLFST